MPDRPGLDDDEAVKSLIALWRDGAADLQARQATVKRRILRELSGDVNENTLLRLKNQLGRLAELESVAVTIADDLAQGTAEWINHGGLDKVYAAGGARGATRRLPFSFSTPHRAAVDVLSRDLFDDVLVATRFIEDDAKRWIRNVGREMTGLKLTSGTPAKAQARRFKAEMEAVLGPKMGAITYRDGSRHSFGEYGEMLMRTKTGVAYNVGTLNQGRLAGIEFYELLDGAKCGLTSHHDDQLANGLIVDYATAMAYPLAHPNCRRSTNPRPEVKSGTRLSDVPSVQSPGARADQAAFEAAMRAQSARKAKAGRRARRPRRARGASSPTKGAKPAVRAPEPVLVSRSVGIPAAERVRFATSAAKKRLGPGVDAVGKVHRIRPNTPEIEMQWATGGKAKGGHFTPWTSGPKPRRPSRSILSKKGKTAYSEAYEEYRENLVDWHEATNRPEIRVIKRKGEAEGSHLISLWHEMGHWHDFDFSDGLDADTFIKRAQDLGQYSTLGGANMGAVEREALRGFFDAAEKSKGLREIPGLPYPDDYKTYLLDPREVWARAYSQWMADQVGDPGALRQIADQVANHPGQHWDAEDFAPLGEAIEKVLRAQGVMD